MTKSTVFWILFDWVKTSPILSSIATCIILNLFSAIFLGGFTLLAFIANFLPTVFSYFLSAMYIENQQSNSDI
jgi:hypothetical protein